jgi:hypothetical protein
LPLFKTVAGKSLMSIGKRMTKGMPVNISVPYPKMYLSNSIYQYI